MSSLEDNTFEAQEAQERASIVVQALDQIMDVDEASAQALAKVVKRRSTLLGINPALVGFAEPRTSGSGPRISGSRRTSSTLMGLSPSARRASLFGRMLSVRKMASVSKFDLEADEESAEFAAPSEQFSARDSMKKSSDHVSPFTRSSDHMSPFLKSSEHMSSFNEEPTTILEEDEDEYEEDMEDEEEEPRASVLSLPEFDIAKICQAPGFKRAESSGSVDLGSKRYFAKMKDFAPKGFDVMGEKKVLLGVSLGSKNTELACLDAMLQYICANFEECTIMPGDYIYRLTLQLKYGLDDESAEEEAYKAQQDYRDMCTTVLAQYTGMCKFNWLPMSDIVFKYPDEYTESYAQMKALYQKDKSFRDSVKGFSEQYITRISKEDATEAAIVSLRYLLEECAILNCIAMEGVTTMVYAGSIQSIKDICAGKFDDIPDAMKTNLRFVEVAVTPRGKYFPSGERKVLKIGELTVGSVERPQFSTSMNLDEATMKKLYKVAQEARPKVGTLLVTSGKPCKELIIIRKGRAEELLKRDDGSMQRLAVLEEGSIVGADAFFDGKASPVSVNTLEACECSKITMKKFKPLIEKDPQLVIELLQEVMRLQSNRARLLMYELQNMRI